MNYYYEHKATDYDDNKPRIILWTDQIDLKDKTYKPSMYKYDNSREHKLLEVGYVCIKNSDKHKYFKQKLGLKIRDRLEV